MVPLIAIMVITVLATLFGAALLFFVSKVGPKVKISEIKSLSYECGLVGEEKKSTKVSVKFYLVAILFILFDIEIIFLYPWAIIYNDMLTTNAVFIFSEMMVFMAVLLFGLFYVWRSGALRWD